MAVVVRSQVRSQVVEQVAEAAGISPSEVDPHATFDELGLDSLHLMELLVWAKEAYGIEISEGDLQREQTLDDVLDWLAGKVGK